MALNGDGTPPWAWFISQLCESFTCTPLQVLRELGYDLNATPWPLMTEILEFRAYVSARREVLRAEQNEETLMGGLYDVVRETRANVQRVRLGLPI